MILFRCFCIFSSSFFSFVGGFVFMAIAFLPNSFPAGGGKKRFCFRKILFIWQTIRYTTILCMCTTYIYIAFVDSKSVQSKSSGAGWVFCSFFIRILVIWLFQWYPKKLFTFQWFQQLSQYVCTAYGLVYASMENLKNT